MTGSLSRSCSSYELNSSMSTMFALVSVEQHSMQNETSGQSSPQILGQRWPQASNLSHRRLQGNLLHGAPHTRLHFPSWRHCQSQSSTHDEHFNKTRCVRDGRLYEQAKMMQSTTYDIAAFTNTFWMHTWYRTFLIAGWAGITSMALSSTNMATKQRPLAFLFAWVVAFLARFALILTRVSTFKHCITEFRANRKLWICIRTSSLAFMTACSEGMHHFLSASLR